MKLTRTERNNRLYHMMDLYSDPKMIYPIPGKIYLYIGGRYCENVDKEQPIQVIEILVSKRDVLTALARKHGASNIRIFGSVARREATPRSDIGLLVDMD